MPLKYKKITLQCNLQNRNYIPFIEIKVKILVKGDIEIHISCVVCIYTYIYAYISILKELILVRKCDFFSFISSTHTRKRITHSV